MIIDISTKIGTTSNQGGFKGLLDVYSGAAAAYSLRKLSKATTSVVRVRRDSDNAEADFTALEITDGTLEAFCTGTDGLVTTWYDQSGNGNDATQASASSQPKIVSAGVLVTENGKPAIQFSNDYMSTNTLISNSTEATILSVYKNNPAGNLKTIIGIGNSNGYALTTDSGKYNLFYRTVANQTTTDNAIINTQGLIFAYTKSAVNQTMYVNNILYQNITPPSMLVPTTSSRIGAYDGSLGLYSGIQQELILYPSDQSTNRSGIEANINNYYNIY